MIPPARQLTTTAGPLIPMVFPENYAAPVRKTFVPVDGMRVPGEPIREILGPAVKRPAFDSADRGIFTRAAETLRPITRPIGDTFAKMAELKARGRTFFHAHKILSLSLPPAFMLMSFLRGCYADGAIEENRAHLAVPADLATTAFIQSAQYVAGGALGRDENTLSWAESLALVQTFPHDERVVNSVVPRMFQNAKTPEAALVIAHALLDTFSLSPSVNDEQKAHYAGLIAEGFKAANGNFADLAKKLEASGLLNQVEKTTAVDTNGDGQADILFHGYVFSAAQEAAAGRVGEDLSAERSALVDMERVHDQWAAGLISQAHSDQRAAVSQWEGRVVRGYPDTWEKLQENLSLERRTMAETAGGSYAAQVETAYVQMAQDFAAKNPDFWSVYFDQYSLASPDVLGVVGLLVSPYFYASEGMISFLAVGSWFGLGGSSLDAPGDASAQYLDRQAVTLVLPDYGVKGDDAANSVDP
jgi:hypothetical protein